MAGEKPDRIPFIIWDNKLPSPAIEQRLLELGACIIVKSTVWHSHIDGIKVRREPLPPNADGHARTRTVYRTPVGEVSESHVSMPGSSWSEKYLFDSPADYDALEALLQARRHTPAFDLFRAADTRYPGACLARPATVHSPLHSIQEFGWRVPIVVDGDGVIVCGHTRWKAAKKLGLAKVPVHVAKDLTPEQVRAYRIADNKTGELSGWDFEILPLELAELQEGGFNLDMLAFDEEELGKLLNEGGEVKDGLTDPDEVPEPPDEALTKRGDIWVLGKHRLMCGDSASEKDVDLLLDGAVINLVNMDPPYNVKLESRSHNAVAAAHATGQDKIFHHQAMDEAIHGKSKPTHRKMRPKDRVLVNDFVSDEEFAEMLLAWFGNAARVLKPGGSFFIWGGYANLGNYPPALKASKLYFAQALIWDKQHPVLTRKDFLGAYELCFYGWAEGAAHRFYGPNNVQDIWHVKKIPPQQMEHLTAKPVELAVRAMQYSSKPGENVLDLFGGSGSTLLGAEQTGRNAFVMEIDELYCDVIVDRYQRFSGNPGVLVRTGDSPIPMKAREENMR